VDYNNDKVAPPVKSKKQRNLFLNLYNDNDDPGSQKTVYYD